MEEIKRDYDLVMKTQGNVISSVDISYIHYLALIYARDLYEKLRRRSIRGPEDVHLRELQVESF